MHKVALKKPPLALKFANFFGSLGYVSLLFEWMWTFGLSLYPAAKYFEFLLPDKSPLPTPEPYFTANSTVALVVGGIITIICLGLVAYALYAVPRSIAQTGARATVVAARTVMPALTHHRPVSKKAKKRLTFLVVTYIKVAAIALPLMVYLFVPEFTMLSKQIVGIVAVFFAAWAAVNFGVQLSITKLAKLNSDLVW